MDAASGICFTESQKITVAFQENIPYRLEASKGLLAQAHYAFTSV